MTAFPPPVTLPPPDALAEVSARLDRLEGRLDKVEQIVTSLHAIAEGLTETVGVWSALLEDFAPLLDEGRRKLARRQAIGAFMRGDANGRTR